MEWLKREQHFYTRRARTVGLLVFFLAGRPLAAVSGRSQADIEYGKAGEDRLLLDVSGPAGPGPFPVALLVHGGGWTTGDKEGEIARLAEFLGAEFTCFSVNYRLAPKYRWPACFDDVQTAVRWVKAHAAEYGGDPRRVALIGYSAGGHLVSCAAVRSTEETRVGAVVGLAPPTDLEADSERRGKVSRALQALLGLSSDGLDEKARAGLREISPSRRVRPDLPPFLLVHGTGDRSVAFEQSLRFQEKLRAAGVSCDLLPLPGAPHPMGDWEKSDPAYKEKIARWLKETLGPAPRP
ncbi:MAG TPA: alpha/beta hydrolase [Elusimicrobiota bacterium]|nr:alpha/beta hydrolase [Elusimicrobiota bacterium]